MALVNLTTNLKSLRYGKDRVGGGSSNQPYIKSSPPDDISNLDVTGGVDFLLRGGTLVPSRLVEDASRLTKMFGDTKSPNGILFTTKQNLLSRTAVATQASGAVLNAGEYLPTSTILQAGVSGTGLHLNKQGLDPFKGIGRDGGGLFELFGSTDPLGLPYYSNRVKSNQPYQDNRLVELKDKKLKPSTQQSNFIVNILDIAVGAVSNIVPIRIGNQGNLVSSSPTEILKYGGGPGSTLGVGKTIIQRYSDTNAYDNEQFKKEYYLLNSVQISNLSSSKDVTIIQDFRESLLNQQNSGNKKNILSKSLNYRNYNQRLEGRVNLGDPGKRNKNISSYVAGLGEPLDKINASAIYKSEEAKTDPEYNDFVRFRIGIYNNENPQEKTYMHFRALLDNMSDDYSAQWDAVKYMGRGEEFYKYNGFKRGISLAWTVAAQSKEELIPMYQKLNFLASSLTPDYSQEIGYMRGNLATLTVGGYLFEQPGIITSINYSVPQESPWEIAINDTNGGPDNSVKQLPHIIKVTNFNFIPIHKFVPRVQRGAEIGGFGSEQYIALANSDSNNYEF